MKWFEHLKVHLFPPVTRRMALDIATQALAQSVESAPLICHGRKPDRFRIYANLPEPCWWVQAAWGDGKDGLMIRSSRVIVIGRRTGTVHYDGSAGDEG
ncbi:MAG: hypothetical protein NTV11_16445 [Rhodocyclales bacterium]|nr:hypothetical protein [Rhodocyclales bacterium]